MRFIQNLLYIKLFINTINYYNLTRHIKNIQIIFGEISKIKLTEKFPFLKYYSKNKKYSIIYHPRFLYQLYSRVSFIIPLIYPIHNECLQKTHSL